MLSINMGLQVLQQHFSNSIWALYVFFIAGLFMSELAWSNTRVVLWERNHERPFFYQTIQNALELTRDEYGDYSIEASPKMEQGRAFVSLHSGEFVNVAIAGISSEKERYVDAIYIPIDRGLLGFRVCLLAAEHRSLEGIKNIAEFNRANLTMGVGSHWPDRRILDFSGFNVAHSPVYEHLFSMLKAKRFDCMLRSVNEVDDEITRFGTDQSMVIDQELAMIYPQGDFVFVSPKNPLLYARLTLGLRRSVADGSYYRLFDEYLADKLFKHQFYSRNIMLLPNPDLSIDALDAINEYGLASFTEAYARQTNSD